MSKRGEPQEWFMQKVDKTESCWTWTGAVLPGGYGKFTVGRKTNLAHRYAYELLVGPIPEGLTIDHLCRVRSCVNPAHLEPVSPAENTRRGLAGNLRTHCKSGHLLSGSNLYVRPGSHVRGCRECRRAAVARHRLAGGVS